MKAQSFLITFILFSLSVIGQNFQWAKNMGGTSNESGRSVKIDTYGNVYITGHFKGVVDFDPGEGMYNLTSAGNDDIFISKLNPSGNFVWAKSIGSIGLDQAHCISLDRFDNVYVTGLFFGSVDFNPNMGTFNLTSNGGYDIFILKLDAAGNFIWAKSMGGEKYEVAESITVDKIGNVYSSGSFQGKADFDPGLGTFNLTSNGDYDIFISKLDSFGNFLWAKSVGGNMSENALSIVADGKDNIYIGGNYIGIVDFDSDTGSYYLNSGNNYSSFVLKLDFLGNLIWAKNTGGADGRCLAIDYNQNVYTTGEFFETEDFDPDTGTYYLKSAGGADAYILKLNSLGNFVWAKSMGGTDINEDSGFSIAIDPSNNVYLAGRFCGTADFDPDIDTFNLISAGISDIFISKLDSSGRFLWAESMGGINQDGVGAIAIDATENIYTTGFFDEIGDFDPSSLKYNLISAGGYDIFVSKFQKNSIGVKSTPNETPFSVFPNPSTGQVVVKTHANKVGSTFTIYDQVGKTILTGKLSSITTNIDLSYLSLGFYLISIGDNENATHKLIIH